MPLICSKANWIIAVVINRQARLGQSLAGKLADKVYNIL